MDHRGADFAAGCLADRHGRNGVGHRACPPPRWLLQGPPSGPACLLLHFGTARAVRNASLEDLQKAPGVSAAVAQTVYDFFHADG